MAKTSKTLLTAALLAATLISCGSSVKSDRNRTRVGGCLVDTIDAGLKLAGKEVPKGAARLSIKSTKDAGMEVFVKAAEELSAILDSLGVTVFRRSDLVHVRSGPCWPAYRITIEIDVLEERSTERIRSSLLSHNIAGMKSSTERPEGYGTFFITAGKGSSDWWTVWYHGDR